jgi:hypothetical protein
MIGGRISGTSGGGVITSGTSIFEHVIFYNMAGQTAITVSAANAQISLNGCTFDTVGTGITFPAATQTNPTLLAVNNQVSNCTLFANNLQSATQKFAITAQCNRFRDMGTGFYTGFTNVTDNTGTMPGDITTDDSDAGEYIAQGSQNFRLTTTALGIGKGLPYGTSIGAWQRYAAIPAATDVRLSTVYGQDNSTLGTFNERTGTLAVPSAANVLFGVSVDNTTGTYVTVATTDVRSGITFGAGSALTGVLVLPAQTDVKNGVQYGANGTEFTGSFAGGTNTILPLGG